MLQKKYQWREVDLYLHVYLGSSLNCIRLMLLFMPHDNPYMSQKYCSQIYKKITSQVSIIELRRDFMEHPAQVLANAGKNFAYKS